MARSWGTYAGLAAAAAVFAMTGCRTVVDALAPPTPSELQVEDLPDGQLVPGRSANVVGFVPCADGLCLGPKTEGSFTYAFEIPVERPFAIATLWVNSHETLHSGVEVSFDRGSSFATLAEHQRLENDALALNPSPRSGHGVLRVSARNDSSDVQLVIDKVVVSASAAPLAPMPDLRWVLMVALGIGLATVAAARDRRLVAVLAAVVIIGLVPRYEELRQRARAPLDPDVQHYVAYAEKMKPWTSEGFYSGNYGQREPGFILAVKAWGAAFGEPIRTVRLMSLVSSLALIAVAAWVAQRLGGLVLGAAAGLLVATNSPLIKESVRGLRTEFEATLFLVFLAAVFVPWKVPTLRRAVGLGAACGALALVRSTYLPATLVLTSLALWVGPWQLPNVARWLRRTAVATAMAAALVVPHRVGLFRSQGDAFADTNAYARWNANVEFQGQVGFPSRAELAVNSYVGEKITYGEYMFGLHTRAQVVEGTTTGFAQLVGHMHQCTATTWNCRVANAALYALALVGAVVAVATPGLRWLPLAFLLLEFPVAFLYSRGLVEPYRHTFPGFPLFVLAATVPVTWLVRQVSGAGHAERVIGATH